METWLVFTKMGSLILGNTTMPYNYLGQMKINSHAKAWFNGRNEGLAWTEGHATVHTVLT